MNQIGGYFSLEISRSIETLHSSAVPLNSGRNCFKYILNCRNPAKVYIPNYICDSILQPLHSTKTEYVFYNIDRNFEISSLPKINDNDLILYVNYFGLKSKYCQYLHGLFKNHLIIDNSQAFFEKPFANLDTFYSPRKFFGVCDGGYLYTKIYIKDKFFEYSVPFDKIKHLIGRIEDNATLFYDDFRLAEKFLSSESIKIMSKFSKCILDSIDYDIVKTKRERNFLYLHSFLYKTNILNLDIEKLNGPMVYPYLNKRKDLRQHLLSNNIFTATYWNDVLGRNSINEFEKDFVDYLIPLPIDQRYGLIEMGKLLNTIQEFI